MSTILNVDDNMVNRKLVGTYLKRSKMFDTILEAEDGDIALEIINQNPNIDVLLLDIYMPKMNGFEVLNSLKEKNIDIYTIVLSTDDTQEEVVLDLGAKMFLSKPVKEAELISVLEKLNLN